MCREENYVRPFEVSMKRSPISPTLFCVAMLLVAPGTLTAQDRAAPDVRISAASPTVGSLDESTAGLIRIYSNLGPPHHVYDPTLGWSIARDQWIAMPFHVKESATVTQIRIAVLHNGGTNGFTMALTEDDHGLPTGA